LAKNGDEKAKPEMKVMVKVKKQNFYEVKGLIYQAKNRKNLKREWGEEKPER
jgi:hypothetical protein